MAENDIGDLVRMQRLRLGMTQAQLAEKARVGKGRIEAIENRRVKEIGLGKFLLVLRALDLEMRVFPIPSPDAPDS